MLGFIKPRSTYRENLTIPDSLDFLGFLHTHFYVCDIHIFTDIKHVFLPRKRLRKHVCHMYGNTYFYVFQT